MKKIIVPIILVIFSFLLVGCEKNDNYKHGLELIEKKEWERATTIFTELGDYKDSKDKLKEIIYISNFDCLNDLDSCEIDRVKESIKKLLEIKEYKDTNTKINSYVDSLINDVNKEIDVKDSLQKGYSDSFWTKYDLLNTFLEDKQLNERIKPKLCSYGKQMYKEGFINGTVVNSISASCENYDEIKNDKYYNLLFHTWKAEIDEGLTSNIYYFKFSLYGSDSIEIKIDQITLYGVNTIKNSSFKYKIVDNKLYSVYKSIVNDSIKVEKEFDIVSVSDKVLKIKYDKKTLTLKKQ